YETYTPINDGGHILSIYVNDSLGHSTCENFTLITDDSNPTYSNLKQTNPNPNYNESNTVSILVSEPLDASGVDTILLYYRIDSGSWVIVDVTLTSGYTFIASQLSYGQEYDWYFWFNDTAGNSDQSPIHSFTVTDTYSPDCISSSQTNPNPEYNETNTVTVSLSEPIDASGVDTILLYYRIDSGSWVIVDVTSTGFYTFPVDQLVYGQIYDWYFWFNDTAGNTDQTVLQSFTIKDSYDPICDSLSQSSIYPEYNESNTINIMVSEPFDASGVDTILLYYRIDSGSWVIVDVTLTSGYTFIADQLSYGQEYDWYFWFNDSAGNYDQTAYNSFFVVDSYNPIISIISPENNTITDGTEIYLEWIGEDFGSGIDLYRVY
ncbi:unnamed protein product, partial [marine sediment metagenome]